MLFRGAHNIRHLLVFFKSSIAQIQIGIILKSKHFAIMYLETACEHRSQIAKFYVRE